MTINPRTRGSSAHRKASPGLHPLGRQPQHQLPASPIQRLYLPQCPFQVVVGGSHQTPTPKGFLSYPGARCNYTNPAVVIGRTAKSALVICETGAGRYYYKGIGLQNGGSSVEIEDPVPTGSGFVAENNGFQYSVPPGALVITQGSSVLSNEPMLEYSSG
jgi:hypothetical protein